MSLLLELPPALEAELIAESERLGVSVSEVVTQKISESTVNRVAPESIKKKTGAEFIAQWESEGLIGIRNDIENPAEFVRELRRKSDNRIRD